MELQGLNLYFLFTYNNNGSHTTGISENSICHLTPAYWFWRNPFATIMVDRIIFVLVFPRFFFIYVFLSLFTYRGASGSRVKNCSYCTAHTHIPQSQDCQYYVGNIVTDKKKIYIYVNKPSNDGPPTAIATIQSTTIEIVVRVHARKIYTVYQLIELSAVPLILLLYLVEKQLRVQPFWPNFNFDWNLSGL